MSSKNFMNTDQTDQNFDGQDLRYSNFRDTILVNASFIDAKLSGSNFRGANVEGCNFSNAEMFYCSQSDLVGTAVWTNALVYGCPHWTETIGADKITTPLVEPYDPLFEAVFSLTIEIDLINYNYFTAADKDIINSWVKGNGGIDKLTGNYGIVGHGHELYQVLGDIPEDTVENILNMCMEQNVSFNVDTQLFYK